MMEHPLRIYPSISRQSVITRNPFATGVFGGIGVLVGPQTLLKLVCNPGLEI